MEILCSLFISFRFFVLYTVQFCFFAVADFLFFFLPSFVTKLSNAFDNVVFVLVVVVVGMFKV